MRGMRAIQVSSYALEVLRVLLAEERLAGQDMDGSTNGKAPVPMRGDTKRRKTEQKKKKERKQGQMKVPCFDI